MFEVVATTPSLPYLLAVFSAVTSIGGGAIGVLAGKASTWRRSFEDIAVGATVGGVFGCMLGFLAYLLMETLGG